MTKEEFASLKRGDIVRHVHGGSHSYVVTANYGSEVIAVDTVHMSNPREWEKVDAYPDKVERS